MALPEIEFELTAEQYERMGYPGMKQGAPLSAILDAGVLLPDRAAESWFAVQPDALPAQFVRTGPATYAFAGQIIAAELVNADDAQTAVLSVDCGLVHLRVTCAPHADGRLPYGTWETRYLAGIGRVQGIIEDEFKTGIGQPIGCTIWGFRRLLLKPGDPLFGEWRTSVELPPLPLHYDRIVVVARLHRARI